jgi:probable addiction module antidote protein
MRRSTLVCEHKDEPHERFTPFALRPYLEEYGFSRMARDTGFSREGLHRAFSNGGNPRLKMILAVIEKLGIHTCFSSLSKENDNG